MRGLDQLGRLETAAPFEHTICFGHRRFAIVDPSPGGHQPFWTAGGEVCVAFNGEIYNYVEVRSELEALGHVFRTESDTEVLAVSYLVWGESCFDRLNGFFAVSLYDARRRQLLIARDRIGEAPFYIAETPEGLYWSSEINGLFAMLGRESFSVNDRAVVDFVRHQRRDFLDETCFREIRTFPAASFAWVGKDGSFARKRYWAAPTTRLGKSDISIDEAATGVRELLDDAVRIRLRADVEVAVQFSGGLDSSALLALGTRHKRRLAAYTVSFPEPDNEEPFARRVVDRYDDRVDYHVMNPPDDEFFADAWAL